MLFRPVIFFKHIVNFSICEFSKLFSDVHSPISLSLKCENKDEIKVTENVSNRDDPGFVVKGGVSLRGVWGL